MSKKTILYEFQDKIFNIVIIVSWILYISILTGISVNAPKYLDTFDYYVKIYVCLFLIFRFNPFTKIESTDLDRKIAFSAGIFLFTTSSLNQISAYYLEKLKSTIVEKK